MDFVVVVPTLNAGPLWPSWWAALRAQSMQPARVLIMDSASTDSTAAYARAQGAEVHAVARAEFNHGGTRRRAAELSGDADILIFLTQDAVLSHQDALLRILGAFDDSMTGAAYGRQLPRLGANPIEAHARLFNYPPQPHRVTPDAAVSYGIKAPFLSNSFSAYRRIALDSAGGFPSRVIQSEDMYVGARLLAHGWCISYASDAQVYHSHAYSLGQEFQRYFDIGVFHSQEPWIRAAHGSASGEGLRFVRSEFRHLLSNAPWLIPAALIRTVAKLFGFHLGLRYALLAPRWRKMLSMQKYYWAGTA